MFRRYLAALTTLALITVSLVSVVVPVSAQAVTLTNANQTARLGLIERMGSPTFVPRTPPVTLPRPSLGGSVVCQIAEINPLDYYGRQVLASSDNADLVKAYDALAEAVAAYEQAFNFSDYRVTVTEAARVYYYFKNDHPEAFWLTNELTYYSFGYSVVTGMPSITLVFTFNTPKEEIPALQQQLEARTEELMDGITGDMPLLEREAIIRDRLCASAEYDHSYAAPHNHDLLGVMLYGTGVCESYTRAFQYLMYRCGIQCINVHGDTTSGFHVWNMVNIDGEWLMTDLTAADDGGLDAIAMHYYNFTYAEWKTMSWYTSIAVKDPYYYPLPIALY
ncbi:MAG: transglutaminase domain-containing protein [Clostridia bacterium]|nr:transglutaminase domain-containing protein [Clostridia bacterium]